MTATSLPEEATADGALADPSLDPWHAMQFRLLPHPRSGAGAQPAGLLEVTVTVRWIPLVVVTVPYGTRVARPLRTTLVSRGVSQTFRQVVELSGREGWLR
jgi:hypothetical protein